ncbi:MAG: M6 family metalloprotease domain-containing protein, partial [Candidatus Marinimicrobia bacterium]|nr:M6 family metalloprotease domain-containing protein [Candidatus Neomarinimicrobiota bacterium]
MFKKLILINIISLTIVLASSPPKPGVNASQKVQQFTTIMAADYHQGGLVAKMQRIKESNIQNVENGNRDLREDVYMSFPVILGSYADSDDLDTVRSMLQQELFDGPWPSPTMAEHYAEMSYDQFHLSGNVYGWFELGSPGDFYEGSQSEPYDNGFNGPPGGAGEFLRDALDLADLEIDFSLYDNDGPDGIANSGDDDGYVDAAFFAHSGRGGEGGGPYIWSHRWVYSGWWGSAYQTNDTGFNGTAIRVNDYIMQPAVSTNGGLIEIGVFSHEFGHALGLPDLYDTDYSSGGVGSWCLMASGSWSTPSSPTHMSVWCKEMLGWIVPVFPDENIDVLEFLNVEENAFAVKLWTHGELEPFSGYYSHGQDVGQEYFLIENRQRIGTEQHIPGTGLMIWHIDNSQYTNNNENHRMVDVKPADGHFNGSSPGDAWPGTTDNRNFDFETTPAAIGWAGVNTEVAVLNISDSDSTMTADIEVHEVNPHISIVDLIVSDENGDNIFTPGENVQIWLIVENSGGTANNLTATLSANGAPVDIYEELIDFNPIGFMATGTSNLPFEFDVHDTLTPQIVTFDVGFTSDEILEPDRHDLILMMGSPEVAIIDDDEVISG